MGINAGADGSIEIQSDADISISSASGLTLASSSGTIDVNSSFQFNASEPTKITGLAAPSANTDATTKIYVDTEIANVVAYTSRYLEVANASFSGSGDVSNSYLTSSFTTNTTFQSVLSNTNLAIADRIQVANVISYTAKYLEVANATSTDTSSLATWTALTSTNTAIRTLVSDRMQVANVNSINTTLTAAINDRMQVANTLSLVNDRMQVANVEAYLANTNLAIADRMQVANANLLINDRMQVANADAKYATWNSLTSTNTAIRSAISTEISNLVDSAPETLNTLNELAAALGDDANFSTTLTTNLGQKLGGTASVTLTGDVTGSGSFSSNSVSIVLTDTNLGNTNSYIATKVNTSTFNSALANTNLYIATKLDATTFNSALANTNAYIATKLDSSSYTTADVQSKAALANTNSYIATKLDSSSYTTADVQSKAALANTNAYIATKLEDITGESLSDLSDVYSSMSPTDGQILTYDTTNGWQAEGDIDVSTANVNKLVETVYSLTGSDLDPSNGSIQYKTVSSATTFTDSLSTGESMTLHLISTSSTVTWPTMTWIGYNGDNEPTLNGTNDVIILWKVGSTLYGAYIGNGA